MERVRGSLASLQARQRALSTRDRLSGEQASVGGLRSRREDLDTQRRLYQSLLGRMQDDPGSAGAALTAILSSPGSPRTRWSVRSRISWRTTRPSGIH